MARASSKREESGHSEGKAEGNGSGGLQNGDRARDQSNKKQGGESDAHGSIATAIPEIMKRTGSIAKTGTNEGVDNWKYVTIEELLTKVQPLLAEYGVIVIQEEIRRELLLDDALLAITYQFSLGHRNGTYLENAGAHTGMSTIIDQYGAIDDKAANKCHTAARKYYLLGLLQIPTTNIADGDREANKTARQPRQSKPKEAKEAATVVAAAAPLQHEFPRTIPYSGTGIMQWAAEFAAHIRAAETEGEIENWWIMNNATLDDLVQVHQGGHDRLSTITEERKNELRAAKAKKAEDAARASA